MTSSCTPNLLAASSLEIESSINQAVSTVARELDSVQLPGTKQDIVFIANQIKKILNCAEDLLHTLPQNTINHIAEFHSDGADLVLVLRNGLTACSELSSPEGYLRLLLSKFKAEGYDEYHFSKAIVDAGEKLTKIVNDNGRVYQDSFIRLHGSMNDQPLFEGVSDHVAGCVKTLVDRANFGGIESQAEFLFDTCAFSENEVRTMLDTYR